MEKRETFASRLGFILISAGCAIGLGDVWRFPYITGKYGGGIFVLIYLVFIIMLGLPIMSMELAVGRASRKSIATSFKVLEKNGQKWHWMGYAGMAGNYILMMFYTTVASWMLAYFYKFLTGRFEGIDTQQVCQVFDEFLASPLEMTVWMVLTTVICFGICSFGLQEGVEKVTKIFMVLLLAIIIVLAVRSLMLPNAVEGLKFYLLPDFSRVEEYGLWETVYEAMSQAFFTLSIGIGSLAIFGSYIGKERSLLGESIHIAALDTVISIIAGLIIFPACFSFGVDPGSGPGLVFVTLPNIFHSMAGGRIWGSLFFLFMSFAAFSTVIAVFENIISFAIDLWSWSRKKAAFVNTFLLIVLSMPCVLGFNVLKWIQPLGPGSTILELEDFIISNNILPIGSLVYVLFCVSRYGWGFENFMEEVNAGEGVKMPRALRGYLTWVLPAIILLVLIQGYIDFFG
ncbi:transporter [Thermoclostridium stercorarium subsp. stercorarium DSM 8532]|uniref:Transporter n=2 Tax=Thermoclostridium stercorarium TaxID=1510 RepID=L7VRL2_THES1|nr:sodium-dependent transporter [Thermoclostridium stercorarium]AGC69021.1 transporter [Thermoclostridium stercorarium subsp. stercorarium DSM 8532]AGI39997.1 sodium transporter [Thermoclostridium stercorarium subsp. stercorarium DSM 8532]ANW99315.1 transporter [Thermoclostridium stercorarium subsp. thermolacticum DSM 2910]UZQ84987.1 sodium-dependent transporter [Thermoclostridium stercorarium]